MTDIPIDFVKIRHAGIGVKWSHMHPRPKQKNAPLISEIEPSATPPPPITLKFPSIPPQNIKPLKERLAELEVYRNKVSKDMFYKMTRNMRDSARDFGEILPEEKPSPPRCIPLPEIELPGQPTITEIQQFIAIYFDIGLDDLLSAKRLKNVARSRQIAIYLCRHLIPKLPIKFQHRLRRHNSLTEIGMRFGKDHTTILYSVRKITRLIETDNVLAEEIAALKGMLLSS